ncbi:MAG: cation diffusion facilitator family transporter [Bacteroidales bacterium]
MQDKERTGKIVRASWIAIGSNAALAAMKISVGLVAGSLAVVGDGIDSAGDIVTSLITLVTARIISKPPNLKFPYGYQKADSIAAKALSFIIFFAGAQLAISTIGRIIEGGTTKIPDTVVIYVIIISIIAKYALSYYLLKTGRKLGSPMLIANGRNMRNDVMISASVLVGLFFTITLKLPVIDAIFALLISIWIMKSGFDIFMETNIELMDGVSDQSVYDRIFETVQQVEGASNPHRVRVRKLGSMYVIGIDIEVDPELKVGEAHLIAQTLERQLKKNIGNIYDILVHVEPQGNYESDEKYGISTRDFKPD